MNIEPVLFGDVVTVLLGHLNETTGVDTGYRPPADRTSTSGPFLVMSRTGGAKNSRVIDRATVVLESWHNSYAEAHDLAQEAGAHLLAITNERPDGQLLVYQVTELGGPGWDPDPDTRSPRFTATYTADVRGVALTGS